MRPPANRLDPSGPTAIPEYPGQPDGVLRDVIVLPYNDLAACDRILRAHKDEIGALIMEPIVSSFGYVPGTRSSSAGSGSSPRSSTSS